MEYWKIGETKKDWFQLNMLNEVMILSVETNYLKEINNFSLNILFLYLI